MTEKETEIEIDTFNCSDCGLRFGIDKNVCLLWQQSHKKFLCPNGHTLCWEGDTPQQKELKTLRAEVISLKEKLATALADIEIGKGKIIELTSELEIYGINPKV